MSSTPTKDPVPLRAEAARLREEAFQAALKVPKNKRPPLPGASAGGDPTPRFLGGIFQNCGKYYTEASTWYQAASTAYQANNASLGNLYKKRGDEAFAAGDDCMSWW